MIKTFVLWLNCNFQYFLDFEKFGKPAKFDEFNNFMNTSSVIFFIIDFTAVIFIIFSNAFLIKSCQENNVSNGTTDVCGMVGRIWMPFDYDYFPAKPLVFTYEVRIVLIIIHKLFTKDFSMSSLKGAELIHQTC